MKKHVESFDEIIFQNRNQAYGAYELRKKYSKRGALAFIVSVSLLFLTAGIPLIANIMNGGLNNNGGIIDPATWFLPPLDEPKPIPKLPDPPAPEKKDVVIKQPTVVDSLSSLEKELKTMEELSGRKNESLGTDDTTSKSENVIITVVEPVVEEVFERYSIQENPKFQDGDASLIRYIAEHTRYPAEAQEQNIQGTVYIRFVVKKTGEIGETIILRGADPLLDNEALRVIKTLPAWTPGKNNGNPVNVWFIIPVKFKLE